MESTIQIEQPNNKSLVYITKIIALKFSKHKLALIVLFFPIVLILFSLLLILGPFITSFTSITFSSLFSSIVYNSIFQQTQQNQHIKYYFIQDSQQAFSIIKLSHMTSLEKQRQSLTSYFKVLHYKQRSYFLNQLYLIQQTFPHEAISHIISSSDQYQNLQGLTNTQLKEIQKMYQPTFQWPNTLLSYIKKRLSIWILILPISLFLTTYTQYFLPSLIFFISNIIIFIILSLNHINSNPIKTRKYTVIRQNERKIMEYNQIKIGDLVIFNQEDIKNTIHFKGVIVYCKNQIIVNEQLYTGKFQHVIKLKATFNQAPLFEMFDKEKDSQMSNFKQSISRSQKKGTFSASKILPQNIIFQQTKIVQIQDGQVGVVVLDNNLIGKYYKASENKLSKFQKGLKNEYLILALILVLISFGFTIVANIVFSSQINIKAFLLNSIISVTSFVPILIPFFVMFTQLISLIRLKIKFQSLNIKESQKIKDLGAIKNIYFGLRQAILTPRRLSFFLTMYEEKNVQYKKFQQLLGLLNHNDSIKSFHYATGCCNNLFKILNQKQIEQKISDKNSFQARLFNDFNWKFKNIDQDNFITLKAFNDDDSNQQFNNQIKLLNTHILSNQKKGVRQTVLLKNQSNFHYIVTKGQFYNGFQQILQFDQRDQYYNRAAQALLKKGYIVQYICFKDYHPKKDFAASIMTASRVSNLKQSDIENGFKFAGFCVSEQCISEKKFMFLQHLNDYGYKIQILTNDNKNTNFVIERFQQGKLSIDVIGKLEKQMIQQKIKEDQQFNIFIGNGVYSQQGLYNSDVSLAINPSQFQNLCHVDFQGKFQYIKQLFAEGRCALMMTLITIKLILLREVGIFIGQSYLFSQGLSIEVKRTLFQDLFLLIIPLILMNLSSPRNLNRYTPKQTIFSSYSLVQFILTFCFIVCCYVSAFIYGSLQFKNMKIENTILQKSYLHLGRIYYPENFIQTNNDSLVIDMLMNGLSVSLILTLDKRQFWRDWKRNKLMSNLVRIYTILIWIGYNFYYLKRGKQAQENKMRLVFLIDFFIIAMWMIDFFIDQRFQLAVKQNDQILKDKNNENNF